jgi:pyrimidine-nucleoside phosphorylase
MNIYELVKAKRDGRELAHAEIEFLVSGFTRGAIPDYQFSAFLMAVYFQGMTFAETLALTKAMMNSGKVFDLSGIPGPKIDKHSTGGVGDKVSLILAPLVAACGVKVPMVSGRGLGHTGGTLDKLESIPGFRTDLSFAEFRHGLKRNGFAMMGQTKKLAPADKKMYALRDVTATVDSIPLIAASIMSKKLAEGIDGLVLDVKTGNGAFMRDVSQSRRLADTMIAIGKDMGRKVSALITDMNQPLGRAVGNSAEVIEAIEALKGNGEPDLMDVTMTLAAHMLLMSGVARTPQQVCDLMGNAIGSGAALEHFRRMVKLQGGDARVIDDYALLPTARLRFTLGAFQSGLVQQMDTPRIGLLAVELGAGRQKQDDTIDPAVGFWFRKKVGDRVQRGEVVAEVLANDPKLGKRIAAELGDCIRIGARRPEPTRLIHEILGGKKPLSVHAGCGPDCGCHHSADERKGHRC